MLRHNADKRLAIGNYIVDFLAEHGPPQEEIADILGVSQAFVSNYLRELIGRKPLPKAVRGVKRKPKRRRTDA